MTKFNLLLTMKLWLLILYKEPPTLYHNISKVSHYLIWSVKVTTCCLGLASLPGTTTVHSRLLSWKKVFWVFSFWSQETTRFKRPMCTDFLKKIQVKHLFFSSSSLHLTGRESPWWFTYHARISAPWRWVQLSECEEQSCSRFCHPLLSPHLHNPDSASKRLCFSHPHDKARVSLDAETGLQSSSDLLLCLFAGQSLHPN